MLIQNHLKKIIFIIIIIFCIFILTANSEKDIRPYIYIEQQVKFAQKNYKKQAVTEIHTTTLLNEMKIEGVSYLQSNGTVIIIINKPIQSGFLFTNINGGNCYKFFGSLYLQGFLVETRKICKNISN